MTERRSVNIYDYPEHLNPFFEDDSHTKLRFWTNTKRKTRSNSFSFQSVKDFKQSLFSRSAIRKRSGTSSSSLSQLSCYHTHEKNDETPQNDEFSRSDEKRKSIIYPTLRKLGRSFSIRSKNKKRDTSADRSSQSPQNVATYSYARQTMPPESHIQRVPVTPLPRIRFHERVRNIEPEKSEGKKPASPIDDTNPFKDEGDTKILSTPSSSKTTTPPPRKKKRAPPPPPLRQSSLTRKSLSAEFSLHGRELEDITINEISHKDIERTEVEITKIKIEIPKIEITKAEDEIPKAKDEIPKAKDEIPKTKDEILKAKDETPKAKDETPKAKDEIPKAKDEVPKAVDEVLKEKDEVPKAKNEVPKAVDEVLKEKDEVPKAVDEIPKAVDEVLKEKDEDPKVVDEVQKEKDKIPKVKENISSTQEQISSETKLFQINYNSELNIPSSKMFVSPETRLEEQQQLNAVKDSSDLLELVQKLQLEVEKLTDDTNNNIIESSDLASGKRVNFYSYDDGYVDVESNLTSSSKIKTKNNMNFDGHEHPVDDDDDDVVIGAPLSPRLVRLKKDNEWIRH